MTSPDRLSLGLMVVAVLCCAAPVLVGTGLAAAALGAARQHRGWLAVGIGLVALVVFVRVRRAASR